MIYIPGFLGSVLADKSTDRKVWGSLFRNRAVTPYGVLIAGDLDRLDLPTSSTDLSLNRDALVATGLLGRMTVIPRLLFVKIYKRWAAILAKAGSTDESILHPKKTDTTFVFYYDWRRDLVESARLLAERIDAIRAASGDPNLKVDIVAHSMGGLIARYYLLYGGEDVLGSETPPAPTMAGARHVANLALLGTPNAGSMPSFMTLLYGGKVGLQDINLLAWFTMPALYELLPCPGETILIDTEGHPVALDLYDVGTWTRNSWGIFNPALRKKYRKVLVKHKGEDGEQALAAKYSEWTQFVRASLERAKRFHQAIAQDKHIAMPVRYHLFGGNCRRTLNRGVVQTSEDGRQIVLPPARKPSGMSRKAYRNLIFAKGDGVVASRSLLGSDSPDAAFLGADTFWSCVQHDKLQNDASVHERVIEAFTAGVESSRTRPSTPRP